MDIEKTVKEFIVKLGNEELEYLDKLKEIRIKLCVLNELLENHKQTEIQVFSEVKESITKFSGKIIDQKDIKKINMFLEYSQKCPNEIYFDRAKKLVHGLDYYVYNKKVRLWSNWQEFLKDYKLFSSREGYWTNALPKYENKPDDPNFPIMKIGNGNKKENTV